MPTAVRYLLFDVFGTLFDWRSGVAQALGDFLSEIGRKDLEPFALADAWRRQYQPSMDPIRRDLRAFVPLDVLHRESLDHVLTKVGIYVETIGDRLDDLNLAWHRLPAWTDVAPGLATLRERFFVAPLSNGNFSLLGDLADRGGIVWDRILGAEATKRYKPDPRSYLETLEILGAQPKEAMMVAAHERDLEAAARCGLRTAYISRPEEFGLAQGQAFASSAWDIATDSLPSLSECLAKLAEGERW
ncbi:MAG: haloacid dehalogenase type II [Sphingomonadales bacterium]